MATQGKGAPFKRKASLPVSDYAFPPVYVAPPRPLKQDWENIMGWIAACVLVGLFLPLLGMLYLDILEAKHEVKAQVEKVERLKREVEQSKREEK
jgi:hypothetical protein